MIRAELESALLAAQSNNENIQELAKLHKVQQPELEQQKKINQDIPKWNESDGTPFIVLHSNDHFIINSLKGTMIQSFDHIEVSTNRSVQTYAGNNVLTNALGNISLFAQQKDIDIKAGYGNVNIQSQNAEMTLASQNMLHVYALNDLVKIESGKGILIASGESKAKATRADFDQAVAAKLAEYSDSFSVITDQTPVKSMNNKIIKIFWGNISKKLPDSTDAFAFVFDRGTLFLIKGNYSDKFKSKSREGIQYLVENIHARNHHKLPTEQGCGYAANNKESEAGKTMIDLNNMKDWCVGRYTFKLPKDAEMINESINYDSFKIESKAKATRADFDQAVASGIAEYNDGFKLFLEEAPLKNINNKAVKVFWGKLSKKRPDLEQGICIKNGFIKDEGENYKFTRQKVGFQFANAPSVVISAETEAIYKTEDDLLVRTEKNLQKSPNYLRTKNQTQDIKKGSKAVNPSSPIQGLELVTQVPMDGGTGIIATWEHAGTVNSALDPLISITVDTARPSNGLNISSIPNHNGILMYEAILNSLKKF
ncbi:hypothetical protein FQR65_LT17154 [Abscondita terminalis]|nr:hypothetical protein FQR65_LT17154 [Abscondita terminalis]